MVGVVALKTEMGVAVVEEEAALVLLGNLRLDLVGVDSPRRVGVVAVSPQQLNVAANDVEFAVELADLDDELSDGQVAEDGEQDGVVGPLEILAVDEDCLVDNVVLHGTDLSVLEVEALGDDLFNTVVVLVGLQNLTTGREVLVNRKFLAELEVSLQELSEVVFSIEVQLRVLSLYCAHFST